MTLQCPQTIFATPAGRWSIVFRETVVNQLKRETTIDTRREKARGTCREELRDISVINEGVFDEYPKRVVSSIEHDFACLLDRRNETKFNGKILGINARYVILQLLSQKVTKYLKKNQYCTIV